ncbi:hypothetical protein WAI453_001278 [Rhynchosporium graminicola]
MRYVSFVLIGLSAFTLAEAGGLSAGKRCNGPYYCKTGICTNNHCVGSGKMSEECLVAKTDSCLGDNTCKHQLGASIGRCL